MSITFTDQLIKAGLADAEQGIFRGHKERIQADQRRQEHYFEEGKHFRLSGPIQAAPKTRSFQPLHSMKEEVPPGKGSGVWQAPRPRGKQPPASLQVQDRIGFPEFYGSLGERSLCWGDR